MYYIGLDLHLKSIYGTIIDENGELIKKGRFKSSLDDLRSFLEGFKDSKEP